MHATQYTEEKSMLEIKENGAYSISTKLSQANDSQMSVNRKADDSQMSDGWYTEVRLDKDRLDKISLEEKNEANASYEKNLPKTFITITLNDKSEYAVTVDDVDEYKKLYPAADVEQALRNMKGWCDDHPTNRKTRNGIKRFIGSWLRREQDRGGKKEKGWWE